MSGQESMDALLERGYVRVEEFGPLRVGQRVRNAGEQYPKARDHGTAVVEGIFHRPDSSWERKWGRPDVEVVVLRDDATFGGTHGVWSDYGTVPAWEQAVAGA